MLLFSLLLPLFRCVDVFGGFVNFGKFVVALDWCYLVGLIWLIALFVLIKLMVFLLFVILFLIAW